MLNTGRIAMGFLKVKEALEQKLHLLGRQRQVRCALKQTPRTLPVSRAYLLRMSRAGHALKH